MLATQRRIARCVAPARSSARSAVSLGALRARAVLRARTSGRGLVVVVFVVVVVVVVMVVVVVVVVVQVASRET